MRTWDDWIRLEKKKYKNLGMDPQELKEEVLSRFGIMPRSGERALMYLYSAFHRNEPDGVVTIVTDRAIHLSDGGVVSLGEAASSILYLSPVGKSQITLLTMDNDINLTGQRANPERNDYTEMNMKALLDILPEDWIIVTNSLNLRFASRYLDAVYRNKFIYLSAGTMKQQLLTCADCLMSNNAYSCALFASMGRPYAIVQFSDNSFEKYMHFELFYFL